MNAIILAAGTSSRFVPLSLEKPKGLLVVKGEVLIERQIRQLIDAGIDDITIVTGYKADMFAYLRDKYGVETVFNGDYYRYNNTSSIIRVIDKLGDTYICCSDHYYKRNVFGEPANDSYYSALYAKGATKEYCLSLDDKDYITGVDIGGKDAWYMAGHVFFTQAFSESFKKIITEAYNLESVRYGYWEDVYIEHINELPMQLRRYAEDDIIEFDTLDELRQFDESYVDDTRSPVVKEICELLNCEERELSGFKRVKDIGDNLVFMFCFGDQVYTYDDRDSLKIELYQ